ncbi:MAG: hypothetical protein DRP01_01265 [Archaeoglobales archaeon]|nr:MAG: hypothetical protein DRP01_01265 [Archaeoglobales archaeon]
MKALSSCILREKLKIERAFEKPNIYIGFSRELLLEKLFYPFGFIVDSMSFQYRRKITIAEQSGTDLTYYQVLIELNSSNFNFAHAQTNGEDIRFTDADGNLLDYWIEEWDSVNESAKIWVEVPSIPANSSVDIYMYYGNSQITSASDGNATFLIFDDFEDGVLDWTVSLGSFTESGGTLYTSDNPGRCYKPNSEAEIAAKYKARVTTVDNSYDIWVDILATGTYSTESGNDGYFVKRYGGGVVWIDRSDDGSVTGLLNITGLPADTNWHVIEVRRAADGTISYYEDGEFKDSVTDTTYSSTVNFIIGGSYGCYYDWILVRKYVSPEPSVSMGSEETP